jgi:hypothetical protein
MSEFVIKGKAFLLLDGDGALINNIDTDMIFHNKWLHITKLEEMGQYALGNLKGFEDFPKRVQPGMWVVAGRNFGAGSSRQQAVDCFKALGADIPAQRDKCRPADSAGGPRGNGESRRRNGAGYGKEHAHYRAHRHRRLR